MRGLCLLIALLLCGCASNTGSWTQNDNEYTYYPVLTIAGRTIGFSPRKIAEAHAADMMRQQEQSPYLQRIEPQIYTGGY
jgi:hypothetical protein